MVKSTFNSIINDIRELANTSLFINNIKRFDLNWDLTWAAMDTLEDTEYAITSYSNDDIKSDQGKEYLRIYGLFQAIFMQQDAVRNLAEGFQLQGINISEDADAAKVREVRNKYFGHHKYKREGMTTYHGISRMTVGGNYITAWTYPNFSTEEINLREAIATNREYIVKALDRIFSNMSKKKIEYIKSLEDELSEDGQGYAFEKLYSWVYGDTADRAAMTSFSLKTIRGCIDKLEQGLRERYDDISSLGDSERTIAKARYALNELDELYANNLNGVKGNFNAEILADSLSVSFEDLIDVAREINAEFKTKK